MIDPHRLTNFRRTQAELEELILFSVLVAGKPAKRTAAQLEQFLRGSSHQPFVCIRNYIKKKQLKAKLKEFGFGQYTRLMPCLKVLVGSGLCLKTCTVTDLDDIHGIGPKTARMFILHTRPNQQVAVLDVHILRYMRDKHNLQAPKTTPQSQKQYQQWENSWFEIVAKDFPQLTLAEADLHVWSISTVRSAK